MSPTRPPPRKAPAAPSGPPASRYNSIGAQNGSAPRPTPSSRPTHTPPPRTPKSAPTQAPPAIGGRAWESRKPERTWERDEPTGGWDDAEAQGSWDAEQEAEVDPWALYDSGKTEQDEDAVDKPPEDEFDTMDQPQDEFPDEEYGGFEDDFDAPRDDVDPDLDGADKDPPPEEEEEEQAPENEMPAREGDLSLDEIPEDQREAVAGNLELKRALSQDLSNAPGAKRQRTERASGGVPPVENQTASRLARQWRLDRDTTTTFVLRHADKGLVDTIAKVRWAPNPGHPKRSQAEQVYEHLTKLKERKGPPGGPLDAVAAFGHRWHLTAKDDDLLAKLDHKSLRHIFQEYDESRPISEILDDTNGGEYIDDSDLAVPDKPGLFVLGRSQCLELIDPFGDAIVLGDANLTFSVQLAEHRRSLHHSGRTIATTFEKIDTLRERYNEIDDTVKQLEELGAEVMHNVDCTRLAVDPRFQGMEEKIGAVYYNFPHAGVVPGFFDGHPFVRWRHANLMHLFFRALRPFVKSGGSVKVASNSNATGVRYSDIIGGASSSEFVHDESFPFLEWQLSRYRRSYGDRRDETKRPEDGEVYNSQRANTDMVYSFTYKPSGNSVPAPLISYPPTKEELFSSNEGRAGRLPSSTVPRRKKVEELYELFLSYVQGIHVG